MTIVWKFRKYLILLGCTLTMIGSCALIDNPLMCGLVSFWIGATYADLQGLCR